MNTETKDWPPCPECHAGVLYECPACSSTNYPPAPTMLNGVGRLENKLRSLYERIRPAVEVAPWVHDEIKAMLAADNRDAAGVVERALEYLRPHLESGTFAAPDWAIQLASILTGGDGCGTPVTPTAVPAGEARE